MGSRVAATAEVGAVAAGVTEAEEATEEGASGVVGEAALLAGEGAGGARAVASGVGVGDGVWTEEGGAASAGAEGASAEGVEAATEGAGDGAEEESVAGGGGAPASPCKGEGAEGLGRAPSMGACRRPRGTSRMTPTKCTFRATQCP